MSEPQFQLIYFSHKILQAEDVLKERDIYWSSEGSTTVFVRPYYEGNHE